MLHGLMLAADCARGPQVRFLRTCLPELAPSALSSWVGTWFSALFVQYVDERAGLRAMLGTASSVLLRIDIA